MGLLWEIRKRASKMPSKSLLFLEDCSTFTFSSTVQVLQFIRSLYFQFSNFKATPIVFNVKKGCLKERKYIYIDNFVNDTDLILLL